MSETPHDMHAAPERSTAPFSVFLAAIIVVFFLSLSAADSVGFVPDYIDGTAPQADAASTTPDSLALSSLPQLGDASASTEASTTHGVLPSRIAISAIGLDLSIQNPSTRDVQALDDLLVNGPARYVDSAKLGEDGTMIIFAHSSHLPIVHNKMFQAFNRIPELSAGDTITLTGKDGTQYLYSVVSVVKADASDTKIDLSPSLGTRLVLVTCDTLTGKSARYVLTANYVGTYGN